MELKLSDEQYEKIGRESVAEWQNSFHPNTKSAYIAVGRNAVELSNAEVLPAVLAEPSDEELADSAREPNSTVWDYGDYRRARKLFANRLARITAPKDAAVERVEAELVKWRSEGNISFGDLPKRLAEVVRAADREAAR